MPKLLPDGVLMPVRKALSTVDVLELGALVAKLALEPEHAEVVAADEVDVIAGLVLDPGDVVERHVGVRPDW